MSFKRKLLTKQKKKKTSIKSETYTCIKYVYLN